MISMEFKFNHTGDYLVCEMRGIADVNQWPAFMKEMLSHEKWRPGTNWLKDMTELNAGKVLMEDVQTIAALYCDHSQQIGAGKCAVVVSRDLEFGLVRMWGVFVGDGWEAEAQVFRSFDEAVAWLGS